MKNLVFIFLLIAFGCSESNQHGGVVQSESQDQFDYFEQPYRSGINFSLESGRIGKPTSAVYYKGSYHVFLEDGDTWSHLVSSDLVNWELANPINFPDTIQANSGSIVVDQFNTSGYGTKESPALIGLFSYQERISGMTSLGMLISTDEGLTWEMSDKDLNLNSDVQSLRDPKVAWHPETEKWIMWLAAGDHLQLFGSYDLRDWVFVSQFGHIDGNHDGAWRKPDFAKLKVEGVEAEAWALFVQVESDSSIRTQYFVGQFDGFTFINNAPSSEESWLDQGQDDNAIVNFNSSMEIQVNMNIGIGAYWPTWTGDSLDVSWDGILSVPRQLSLVYNRDGVRVKQFPVQEFTLQRTRSRGINRTLINGRVDWSDYLRSPDAMLDFELLLTKIDRSNSWYLEMSNEDGQVYRFGYDYPRREFYEEVDWNGEISRNTSKRVSQHDQMGVRILLDQSTISVFADMGQRTFTTQLLPRNRFNKMAIVAPDIAVLLEGVVYDLESPWIKNID